MSLTMVRKVLCISCMMDPNASCVSCCVVEAMARRTGREGGTWATAASMVDGSGYQIVMVLDCPVVGTCPRQARRISSYFLLLEYRPLLHLL
jgi:hypothetical protein